MPEPEVVSVLVATVAAFAVSSTYYAVAPIGAEPADQPAPWKLAVEAGRSLVLATVVAGLAARGDVDKIGGGLLLGLALWIGLPLALWSGAVLWEGTPLRQSALHA